MHSSEEVVKLLLMRNLYMKVLVKCFFQSVANEPDLSKKKLNSWMIYFVCKNYLLKITEGLKNKNWRD